MVVALGFLQTLCCGCDELFDHEDLTEVRDGMACEHCIQAVYVTCIACEEKVHEFESLYIGRTSEHYCFDCAGRLRVIDPDAKAG